jgi:putative ABC transport system substrate-binding protein
MRRRGFIALLGVAATWPLTALGQSSSIPTVGFLFAGGLSKEKKPLDGFRDGLRQAGYVEGQNVRVDYRDARDRSPGRMDPSQETNGNVCGMILFSEAVAKQG